MSVSNYGGCIGSLTRRAPVNDVTFSVRRGQVFGFIGPNGAGKTTSMRILATLDLPSYGDAYVDGFSVVNDPELVRRRLGFMPDSFGTYRDVNCREYLDFFARAYGLKGSDRTRRLEWVLDFTGTQGYGDQTDTWVEQRDEAAALSGPRTDP